jgi:16S rRNA processing protein RimM
VRGWVKVYSSTGPIDNIFNYTPWQVCLEGQWLTVELKHGKRHGKGLIAQLTDCQDRDAALRYCGVNIAVSQLQLPPLDSDEYYWQQLIGLTVVTELGINLGLVDHLIATGANDVLVVKGQVNSIDLRQRLIPWLPKRVIISTDITLGFIKVNWDPEF